MTLRAEPGNPPQREQARVAIRTRRGELAGASGRWARMGGLEGPIREMAPAFDAVLVSLNPMPADLQAALACARSLTANATSPKLAPRLITLKGQAAATLNLRELGAIRSKLREQPRPEELPHLMGAEAVLLTKGARGMTLYEQDRPTRPAPAPPVPAGADFIGAGDAATAGLAWATITGEDPLEAALTSVAALLQHNADGYARR